MLAWLVNRRITAMERQLGVPLNYAREMFRVAPRLFFRFGKVAALAEYRGVVPRPALHVASLVTTRLEDCGECLQIGVNLARQEQIPAEIIRAAIQPDFAALPAPLGDVARFAEAVVTGSGADVELRDALRKLYGDAGITELSVAIAVARMFPTVKRGMGYAVSCSVTPVQV